MASKRRKAPDGICHRHTVQKDAFRFPLVDSRLSHGRLSGKLLARRADGTGGYRLPCSDVCIVLKSGNGLSSHFSRIGLRLGPTKLGLGAVIVWFETRQCIDTNYMRWKRVNVTNFFLYLATLLPKIIKVGGKLMHFLTKKHLCLFWDSMYAIIKPPSRLICKLLPAFRRPSQDVKHLSRSILCRLLLAFQL